MIRNEARELDASDLDTGQPHDPRWERQGDRRWHGLYLAAAAAALVTALCIPLQVAVFIAWPPPTGTSVTEWFAIFSSNPLRGLLSLDLLMMVEQVLVLAIGIAFYVQLHRAGESTMALALAAWVVAATLLVASNSGFQMLALARHYGEATSDADRAAIVAAGQAMLTTYWDQGTAFVFGYVLTSVAGIAAGLVMLRTDIFGRAIPYAAIVANVVGLGLFLPVVGTAVSLLSVVVLWVWYALVGLRFWRLARALPDRHTVPSARPQPSPTAS